MAADTIFAPATGGGRAALAVIRISGPHAADVLRALAGAVPPPRHARLARLRDPSSGETLDRGLALFFPAPASFTGEDCAELQIHGGRAVLAAVLGSLARLPGCRPALAGEFTRRALIHGKMDLAAAEGLADLIEAETEGQRRQAQRQTEGALGTWVAHQRDAVLDAMAAAEAAIDFADEGDVAGDFEAEVTRALADLDRQIAAQLALAERGERLRDGVVVAIAGPPNAGKSTLLNALARREVAIVSPHAGTTRDPIEVSLDLHGHLVRCIDTAGLRVSDDPVEQEGIARALARTRAADLVLWLHDAREAMPHPPSPGERTLWRVATKIDLLAGDTSSTDADFALAVPAGLGLAGLTDALAAFVRERDPGEDGLVTRVRHRRAMEAAQASLARMRMDGATGIEVRAEQIRQVLADLDALVAPVQPDEVLDRVFGRFCIGK